MAKKPRERTPKADSDRVLHGTAVAIASWTAALHVIAAQPHMRWMWGAHFYGFYPGWLSIVATTALAVVVLATYLRPAPLAGAVTRALSPAIAGRRVFATAAVCVAIGTSVFWLMRTCHTYLGDGNIIVEEIDTSRQLLERQPLTSLIQYAVYKTTKPWFHDPNRSTDLNAHDALAPGSVLAGFLFLILAWFLARELARWTRAEDDRDVGVITVLLWLVLVAQGYMQLFFGYVENYSFNIVGVLLYLWLSLRHLRGASPLLHPAFAVLLCVMLHLSSLVLGVSFLVLVVADLVRRETRLRALRDLAIAAGFAILVGVMFARIREGYNPLVTIWTMAKTAFTQKSADGYTFSPAHYRDFFNEQLLIGPLGMLLFVPGLVAAALTRGARRQPAFWYASVTGLVFLISSWLLRDANSSYARDWDLLSHTGLVFTTVGFVLLLARRARPAIVVASLVCAAAASFYHTTPWVALNTNEPRSLARLASLPLAPGQGDVIMSTYYRQRGDTANQRRCLQQALQANPSNVNAIYLLGVLDLNTGRYAEAVTSLEMAIRMRPEKAMFRMAIVQALNGLGRLQDAIPHLEMLARVEPKNVAVHVTLGESLKQVGRDAESRAEFELAETLCRPMAAQHPNDPQVAVAYGFVLWRLQRLDEAEGQLARAIALNPQLADAHCSLGYVLRDKSRAADARKEFEACLRLNPAYAGRPEIEQWLASNP